jgi:hypothetical protein
MAFASQSILIQLSKFLCRKSFIYKGSKWQIHGSDQTPVTPEGRRNTRRLRGFLGKVENLARTSIKPALDMSTDMGGLPFW